MKNTNRYLIGFVIGMCLEYAYRVDSGHYFWPLTVAVLNIVVAIVDLIKNK